MRKYRRSVDPRYGWAGIGELLHQLEYILIYIVGTFAFAAYLVWLGFGWAPLR